MAFMKYIFTFYIQWICTLYHIFVLDLLNLQLKCQFYQLWHLSFLYWVSYSSILSLLEYYIKDIAPITEIPRRIKMNWTHASFGFFSRTKSGRIDTIAICRKPPAEKAKIKLVLMIDFVALFCLFIEPLSNTSAAIAPTIPTVAVQNWAFAASHLKMISFGCVNQVFSTTPMESNLLCSINRWICCKFT